MTSEHPADETRRLTHLDAEGQARMVDVGDKAVTRRRAVASGRITMEAETLEKIEAGGIGKGDVLAVARIAGIQAGKDTSRWIPLCHPLPLEKLDVDFDRDPGPPAALIVRAEARTTARTGVEMEALTAAAAALLVIYDMAKAVDRGMVIGEVRLEEKEGGRSGHWIRGASDPGNEGTGGASADERQE